MSYVQRLDKGRWKARYRGPDGRERSKTFALERDAREFLSIQSAALATGKWADPAQGKTTLKEWSDRWLSTVVHLKTQTSLF